MSSASVSFNYPRCRYDLDAKQFTCFKGSNRGKKFYGWANFISKKKSECGFFQWCSEDESMKIAKEVEDNLALRVERIERNC